MLIGLLAITTLVAIIDAAYATTAKQYAATFQNNGIFGGVIVNDGQIVVNLDMSSKPTWLPGGFDKCTAGKIYNKYPSPVQSIHLFRRNEVAYS